MVQIPINTEYIRLGALLKLAAIAESGVHAKIMILNEEVKVNGEIEVRRGKKIRPGDVVEMEDFEPFKVDEPTKIEVEFQHTGMADAAEMTPFSNRVDGLTVTFEGSFVESYRALQSMIRHAVSQRELSFLFS